VLIRALVLAAGYAGLWLAIAWTVPSWLTVAVAAFWIPIAERFHWIHLNTSPRSLLLLIGAIGAAGALAGLTLRRRRGFIDSN
jgi:hypothetical protein